MTVTMRFGQGMGAIHPPPSLGRASLQPIPLHARIRAAVRRCIAEEIERLVDVLDGLDGDPDLEDGADAEPSLGWRNVGCGWGHGDRNAPTDDREEDVGDEGEPDEDREPALGWTEEAEDQTSPDRMAEPWRWGEDES